MNSSKALVLGLALLVMAVWWTYHAQQSRDQRITVTAPDSFDFQCASCDHVWTSDTLTAASYYRGGFPSETMPIACTSCEKRQAFLVTKCPYCHEGWLPAYVVDHTKTPNQLICPHCGKDSLKWRRQTDGEDPGAKTG